MALTTFQSALNHLPRHNKRPLLLAWRSSRLFITIAVCIAVFTDVFLYAVVVPVIPFAIHVRAGVPTSNVQHWVSILLAVYGAALLVAAPICGVVADRYGSRRAPLLGGLVVLAGATVMLCLGRSISVLVAGRLLQGASAAVVWTVALALLSDTVSKEESGQALGYVATSYSVGVLIAPLLGGVVYEKAGYYAVFGMTFAVIGLDIILRLLIVEKKVAAKWLEPAVEPSHIGASHEIDRNSTIELSSSLTTPPSPSAAEAEKATTTTTTTNTNTNTPPTPSPKRPLPTLLILLSSPRILAATWGNLVGAATMGAFDTTLPLFLNRTFGWTSLGAGLMFIPLILPSFIGPIIGHYTDKHGPRFLAASGLLLSLPIWVLLRLIDHSTTRQIVLLCALLSFMGLAVALILTSLMSEFSKVCDAKERADPTLFGGRSAYAQAYGIFNVAWAAGSMIGPLWAAAVEKEAGWKTMTWSLGLLNAVSVVPILLYSGGRGSRGRKKEGGRGSGGGEGGVLE